MLARTLKTSLGLAAALSLSLAGPPPAQPSGSCPVLPAGTWELAWDDAVDGELSASPKVTDVQLAVRRDRVRGVFAGPVFGEVRDARFTGEVVHADGSPLVLLQQHEPGYRCVYQLQRLATGELRGVWHDTRARSGDVVLRRRSGGAPLRTTETGALASSAR
ncbi:MAG: hypothetical protein P1V81_06310 [Planctomycetota bacterium]|nr:hypothetical protein [Planctomycetota bacterium]